MLSANDVIYLIGKRAELIQGKLAAGTHGMLSISGTTEEISAIFLEDNLRTCEVSYMNGSGVVVSGERSELLRLSSLLIKPADQM